MSEELKLTKDQFAESVEAYEEITGRYWIPTDVSEQKLFIKAAEFGIKLANKSPWISCKERLPEFDTQVLAWCKMYGRFIAEYEKFDGFNAGQWVNAHTGEKGILPPTHWQPLPSPPDKEGV